MHKQKLYTFGYHLSTAWFYQKSAWGLHVIFDCSIRPRSLLGHSICNNFRCDFSLNFTYYGPVYRQIQNIQVAFDVINGSFNFFCFLFLHHFPTRQYCLDFDKHHFVCNEFFSCRSRHDSSGRWIHVPHRWRPFDTTVVHIRTHLPHFHSPIFCLNP